MGSTKTSAMSVYYLKKVSSACEDRVLLSIRWNDTRLVVHLDLAATGTVIEKNGEMKNKRI